MTQAVIQTTVTGMQGRPISTTAPAANQAYTWSGSAWVPTGPYLPLAGGVLTGALRVQYAAPVQIFNDTGTSITAGGLWRESNSGGNFVIQSNTATAGDFSTTATALTLNSNGSVTVGNALTSTGGINCGSNLIVTNPSAVIEVPQIIQFSTVGASINFVSAQLWTCPNWGSGTYDSYNPSNGLRTWTFSNTQTMALDSAGNLTITGGLTQASDASNKTNINPLTQGVSLVRQLVPKSFAWNSTPNVLHWGFIAQDVQPIIPDAVSSMPVEEGIENTGLLSLDITGILAAVTFAIKQIDQRLSAVESHDGITPPAAQLA